MAEQKITKENIQLTITLKGYFECTRNGKYYKLMPDDWEVVCKIIAAIDANPDIDVRQLRNQLFVPQGKNLMDMTFKPTQRQATVIDFFVHTLTGKFKVGG